MNSDLVILIVQIIAALGVVISVVYLGVQIHQQNEITKAQFGHSLTQRQYERYFHTAKDGDYAKFLSQDWSSDTLSDGDKWRAAMFIVMCLVDIFDVYEKVEKGFVDKKHLDIRMNALKFGTMKTEMARSTWNFWKLTRDEEFISWFENEIYGEETLDMETLKESADEAFSKSVR
tara:strand:+ start:275 stop:799 length:525 start_codon:yes stop_codon:yes gene_type:complete